MKKPCLIILLVSLSILHGLGQTTEKKIYRATPIESAPVINGSLDDKIWEEGEWANDFVQNEPYNGRPASQRTDFKILFDEDNLYVAIKAHDTNPDSIVSRLTRRDEADGDMVGIIVDSYHDQRTGFLFGVSSAGVKYDLMFTNDGQNEDESWDPNWWVKTSINKEGWIAEMKIPFSQVRFEKNSGDTWGLEMARVYYRENETDFWQHIPADAPGFIHLIGELSGLEKIKPRKIFDITPYGVARGETFSKDVSDPFMKTGRRAGASAGLDAKIGVTNNITMDLTVNPDFGQVEADPSEVNLTAYETYFGEKRPFFIEGNNIVKFNLGIGSDNDGDDIIFYSRRVGRGPSYSPDLKDGWHANIPSYTNILGAAKLSGKTKKGMSLGFMNAVTSEEIAEIDTVGGITTRTVEPLTNYFIGRVQQDFKDGNTLLGAIFTGTYRDLDEGTADLFHKGACTGGIDFTQYFSDKSWMLNVNAAFSQVKGSSEIIRKTQESSARYFQRPDNSYTSYDPSRLSLAGTGGRMQINKLDGHWNFLGCVNWKSPGFELNDMGYMTQADQVISVIWGSYAQWEPKSFYKKYRISGDLYLANDFGGNIIGGGMEWNASVNLKNYWSAWTGGSLNKASNSNDLLRGGPMMITNGSFSHSFGFSTDYRDKLVLEYFIFYNRVFNKSGHSVYNEATLNYKPSNYLSISLSPSYGRSFNELQYVDKCTFNDNDRYVFASIDRNTVSLSFRVNLNLSPDLTFQYWGQPFVANGNYRDHKFITSPRAGDYRDRFHVYTPSQLNLDNEGYHVDEDIDGMEDYSFGNSDFNVQQFLSNLVVRWEYTPGSTLYLVWSQKRDGSNDSGVLDYFNDMGDLFDNDNKPHNVFLVKFSYRFGLK
jgi:hypothetical protein